MVKNKRVMRLKIAEFDLRRLLPAEGADGPAGRRFGRPHRSFCASSSPSWAG